MNFSDVLKALNLASAFELYRMRAAIDQVLDEPLVAGDSDKTVTLLCGSQQWRVAYCFLHRVMDSAVVEQNVLELEVTPAKGK